MPETQTVIKYEPVRLDLQRHPFRVVTLGEPDLHFSNIHAAVYHVIVADPRSRRGSIIRWKPKAARCMTYDYADIRKLSLKLREV